MWEKTVRLYSEYFPYGCLFVAGVDIYDLVQTSKVTCAIGAGLMVVAAMIYPVEEKHG